MDIIKKFKQLGREKNKLTNQLLAMLPEIFEKELFKKDAETIEEFAGKFAGISPSVVKKTLNLHKKLENLPKLKEAIPEVGVHKTAIAASIATPENEEIVVEKVKNMSKRGLLELRKSIKETEKPKLFQRQTITVELDEEMTFQLLKLQKHLGKTTNKGTLKELLQSAFETTFPKESKVPIKPGRESGDKVTTPSSDPTQRQISESQSSKPTETSDSIIAPTTASDQTTKPTKKQKSPGTKPRSKAKGPCSKEKLSEAEALAPKSQPQNLGNVTHPKPEPRTPKQSQKPSPRNIPTQLKRETLSKHKHRCAHPNCNRPHDVIHHQIPFAIRQSHESIIPLCNIHHELIHNNCIANSDKDPTQNPASTQNTWQPQLALTTSPIDKKFQEHRRRD